MSKRYLSFIFLCHILLFHSHCHCGAYLLSAVMHPGWFNIKPQKTQNNCQRPLAMVYVVEVLTTNTKSVVRRRGLSLVRKLMRLCSVVQHKHFIRCGQVGKNMCNKIKPPSQKHSRFLADVFKVMCMYGVCVRQELGVNHCCSHSRLPKQLLNMQLKRTASDLYEQSCHLNW